MSVACENRDADIYRVCDLKIEPVTDDCRLCKVTDKEGTEWFEGSVKQCDDFIKIGY